MARIDARSKLGDYFVAFRLATRKQVDTCRKGLKAGEMLGQALVKAKVCEHHVCEQVATVQRLYRNAAKLLEADGVSIVLNERTFIGDILVALGFITVQQKEAWLKFQEDERAAGRTPPRLGELLVEKAVCTADERDLAMQVQDWLRGVK